MRALTSVTTTYWPDGVTKKTETVVDEDGNEHGTQMQWYEDGSVKMLREMRHGAYHGVNRWYSHVCCVIEKTYVDNMEQGEEIRRWWDTGAIRRRVVWNQGRQVGTAYMWWKNGQMALEDEGGYGITRRWLRNGVETDRREWIDELIREESNH